MFDDFDDDIKKVYGDKNTLDLGTESKEFILHNHPNNEFFSNQDLIYFANHYAKFMSVVKHNGKILMLEKLNDFNYKDFYIEYLRAEKKYKNLIDSNEQVGYTKVVQRVINKVKALNLLE